MMGFPSISGLLDDYEKENEDPDAGKNTMFGFPAPDAGTKTQQATPLPEPEEPSEPEYDEYDEDDATHLIPADQLQREFQSDDKKAAVEERQEKDNPVANAWGLEADSQPSDDGASTSVLHASQLASYEDDGDSAFSTQGSESKGNAAFPDSGTLMGMNLEDFAADGGKDSEPEPESPRSTQFALPAVQMSDVAARNAADADDSGPMGDSGDVSTDVLETPTEMWNPEMAQDDENDPKRAEVLAKLREAREPAPRGETQRALPAVTQADLDAAAEDEDDIPPPAVPTPNRGPAKTVPKLKGLPDPSTLRAKLQAKLGESGGLPKPSGSADSSSAPGLKPPIPTPAPTPAPATPTSDGADDEAAKPITGVLGGGSYNITREEAKGKALGKVAVQKRPTLDEDGLGEPQTMDIELEPASLAEESELDEDFAYADTGIAPADLVAAARGPQATNPQMPADIMRTQEDLPSADELGPPDTTIPVESPPPHVAADLAASTPEQSGFNATPQQSGFNAAPVPEQSGFNAAPVPEQSGFNAAPVPEQSGFNAAPVPEQSGFNPVASPEQSGIHGNPYQSGLVTNPQGSGLIDVANDPNVVNAQRGAGGAAGGFLFIGGAIGVVTNTALFGIGLMGLSAMSGVVSLLVALLPVPRTVRGILWGLAGVSNILFALLCFVFGWTSVFAVGITVMGGLLAIAAAIYPKLMK